MPPRSGWPRGSGPSRPGRWRRRTARGSRGRSRSWPWQRWWSSGAILPLVGHVAGIMQEAPSTLDGTTFGIRPEGGECDDPPVLTRLTPSAERPWSGSPAESQSSWQLPPRIRARARESKSGVSLTRHPLLGGRADRSAQCLGFRHGPLSGQALEHLDGLDIEGVRGSNAWCWPRLSMATTSPSSTIAKRGIHPRQSQC